MGHFKLKVYLLALLAIFINQIPESFAQTKLEVEAFSGIEGISGNVKDVKEDGRGNLWILTSLQVHKYNPAGSESFTKFSGLPPEVGILNGIFVDDRDNVWVSADNGLLKLEPGQQDFSRLSTNGVKTKKVTGAKGGALWIATNEGIWISNGKELSFVAGFPEAQEVNDLVKVDNQLLIATSHGFFSLTLNGTLRPIPLPGYSKLNIEKLLFDGSSYFLGTEKDGLLRMSADFKKLQKIYSLPYSARQVAITDLATDNQGNLYISTLGDGLVVLDNNLDLVSHLRKEDGKTAFLDDKLTQLYLDKFNRLWIASEGGGFYSVNLKQNIFELVANEPGRYSSLSNNFTTAIEEDSNGNLWFGSKDGLSIWNTKYNSWQHLKNLSFTRRFPNPDVIKDLQADGEHMWIATFNDGVYKVNINTLLRAHYAVDAKNKIGLQKVNTLQLDHQKNIWAAGEDGGLVQIKHNGQINQFQLQGINTLLSSASGELIAGGKKGIFRISPVNGAIEPIKSLAPNAGALSYLNINAIKESATGELVFATEGAGVVIYDPLQDTYQVVSEGLPSENIKSLEIFGRNDIWIGTAAGLSNFKLSQLPEIRNFGESDGLVSKNFTGSSLQFKNRLAFGTSKGVQIFNPSELKKIAVNLPIVAVKELKLKSSKNEFRNLDLDEPLNLGNKENSLSFSFAGSQPGNDSPLLYSWRLSGYDENWSEPEAQNKISFASLGSGDYLFQVKGLASDGTWSEVQEVPFHIQAPWWYSSRAFFGFGSALVAIGLVMIFSFRSIRKRREKQERAALLANMNQEFGAPLKVLLSTLDNIAEEEEVRQKTRLKTTTTRIRQIIDPIQNLDGSEKRKSLEISEIVVDEYLDSLLFEIKPLLKEKNIEVILNNQFGMKSLFYDVVYLNNIFLNILSSSIRYCTQNGKIIIFLIGTNKGDLKIQITDNGLGMPEKEKRQVQEFFRGSKSVTQGKNTYFNNLLAVKDYLMKAGGSISFESSRNEGTTFTFILTNHAQAFAEKSLDLPAEKELENPKENASVFPEKKAETERIFGESLEAVDEGVAQETDSFEISENEEEIIILVAEEDNELKAEIEALKQLGRVQKVQNVIEAYQMTSELQPTFIVTSAGRPGIDGLVLWKALRNNPELAEIPVYLLYTDAGYLETAGITKQATLIPVKKANNPDNFIQLLAEEHRFSVETIYQNPNLAERNSRLLKKEVDEDVIAKLQKLIIQNLDESSFSVDELCRAMGVRKPALEVVVEDCKGVALDEFIIETKLEYAKNLIVKGDSDLSEVARKAGFKNKDIFFYLYKKHFGFMPGRIIEKS